jgi:hypothetical protein
MERKDFLLLEIEKIGLVISAIRQKLFGGRDQLATNIERKVNEAKATLLSEVNFDLDKFCMLDGDSSLQYLKTIEGFNIENIERLAELLSQIGFSQPSESSKMYLEKSLQLYDFCNWQSKSYSIEREEIISNIKNSL